MTRRRHWFAWAFLAYAVIIAVVSFALVNLYAASRDRLDQAMGERLLAVAVSLATTTDGKLIPVQGGGNPSPAYLDILEADFFSLSQDQELAEISLMYPDGTVLLSTDPSLEKGLPNDFWELSRGAVDSAIDGIASSTPLYFHQNNYQKSAHAPVRVFDPEFGDDFVVAVVTVSGNARFFDSLAQLKKGAILTGAMVLIILISMGVFLYRINMSFERYQESIRRQENLAAMGRMTAGIAHEIRNPLGIIRGAGQHLQRILKQADIDDPVADFIPEEVDRLNHILTGYLSFGSQKESPAEAFDLSMCLRRSQGMIQEELQQTAVEILLPEVMNSVMVMGDPLRLQQVILNLLINARDAMPDGGKIQVDIAPDGGTVTITIADSGSGLGGVDSARLFEPFWTNKEKGSGLGLAMSRRIIEDMSGSLELRDRHDQKGALAEIILPVHRESS